MPANQNYIGTWIYLDSPEEKSNFPNNKGNSSTPEFQAVYWRCIVVFFETSLRFHSGEKNIRHILFTNTSEIPIVDGMDLDSFFKSNNIQVIPLENKYPLPSDYFKSFRNQFFEFTIINYMASKLAAEDRFLLLDSDCVFAKDISSVFPLLEENTALTLDVGYGENADIHGINRKNMKNIFEDLGLVLDKIPVYCGGEVLLATGDFIKKVSDDFPHLYDELLIRNKNGQQKFNEEAHVLSYYYYKHKALIGYMNQYMKRMWTNRNYFRNILPGDQNLAIWHLPNEKPVGLKYLFELINNGESLQKMDLRAYQELLVRSLLLKSNHELDYFNVIKNKVNRLLHSL